MNPEEGELRPQLLDRFGLSVEVRSSSNAEARAEAVRRRLAFDADPSRSAGSWEASQAALSERLASSEPAELSDELLVVVSRLCSAVGAEGLRADLVICRAAAAVAGWEGRSVATLADVRRVAPMALAHRRRRNPFDAPGIDDATIEEALDDADGGGGGDAGGPEGAADGAGGAGVGGVGDAGGPEGAADGAGGAGVGGVGGEGDGQDPGDPVEGRGEPGGQMREPAPIGEPRAVSRIGTGRAASGDRHPGRRSTAIAPRGRQIGDRVPEGPVSAVALGATARAAASRRALLAERGDPAPGEGPLVVVEDLREPVCERRVGNLLVIAVDASASMGVERRMEATKGAVLGLLLDAYQRRDRVSLVTFRGESSDVVLRPTGSVEVAKARLAELPTGGRTPLAAGILDALGVATGAPGDLVPLLILVSDGRATAGPSGQDPLEAARRAAGEVRRRGVAAIVVDVEEGPTRLGLARELAEEMGARHLTLPELSSEAMVDVVRRAVRS